MYANIPYMDPMGKLPKPHPPETLQTETPDATAFLLWTNLSHSFMNSKPWLLGLEPETHQ